MTMKKISVGDSKDILLWNIFAVTVVQKNAEESFASKSFAAFKKVPTLYHVASKFSIINL